MSSSNEYEYDESNYPDCWDEDEQENSPKTFEEDMLCAVCAQVLVDPLTLRCGHSFCRICLARVWYSKSRPTPASIQCPSCRQLWGHLPLINIQLRNIIDHSHKDLVDERKNSFTDQDRCILDEFSKANFSTNQNVLQRPQELQRVVACLGVLFVGVIVTVVLVSVLAVWVLFGASGEFMRKPIKQWSNDDVISWVNGLGEWTSPNISQIFRVEALTGPQLLLVNDHTLTDFGIESEFRRQTILQAINELEALDYSTPKNFHQFKAAHRRTTLLLALSYSVWPRLTFIYASLFDYYLVVLPVAKAQFTVHQSTQQEFDLSWSQFVVFALEVVLFPHLALSVVALHLLSLNPWVGVPLLVHCMIAMVREMLAIFKTIRTAHYLQPLPFVRSLVRRGVGQLVMFSISVALFFLLWPAIPHFICDLVFYVILWNTLAAKLILSPLNYLLKKINNHRHRILQP